MAEKIVRDLTVPGDEYITLSRESTLMDAVIKLTQQRQESGPRGHSSIIVTGGKGKVVSMLTMFDILRGLDTQYQDLDQLDWDKFGFGGDKLERLFSEHGLWLKPLEDLCARVDRVRIGDMSTDHCLDDSVSADSTLDQAIKKMIQCRAHNLLVFEKNEKFLGVLRTVDLFNHVCSLVERCNMSRKQSGGE
jgi:CBS domain-containing protein